MVRVESGFKLASRPEAKYEATSEATPEAQWEVRRLEMIGDDLIDLIVNSTNLAIYYIYFGHLSTQFEGNIVVVTIFR